MNGIRYVADTNCFIYLLQDNDVLNPFLGESWAFCYITEIELLSKKDLDPNEDAQIRAMLSTCYKVNHSELLTDLTIQLKRKNNLKLPDAIIAATALMLNLPLITADKSFANVSAIDCILLNL
ncbi:MAG: PIN domain-containing protein [Sphingobacteriales bacterium]